MGTYFSSLGERCWCRNALKCMQNCNDVSFGDWHWCLLLRARRWGKAHWSVPSQTREEKFLPWVMGGIKLSFGKIANLRSSSSGIYSDRVNGVMCIQTETCLPICISQRPLSIYSGQSTKKYWQQGTKGKLLHYQCSLSPEAVHKAHRTPTRVEAGQKCCDTWWYFYCSSKNV